MYSYSSNSALLIEYVMERNLTSLQSFLEYEISQGFDINSVLPVDRFTPNLGWTLIFYAAESGDISILDYLCSLGADINIRDSTGSTICHYLIKAKRLNLLTILLNYEVDLDIRDCNNYKAYEYKHVVRSDFYYSKIDSVVEQFKINKLRRKTHFLFVMKYSQLYSKLPRTIKRFILEMYFA